MLPRRVGIGLHVHEGKNADYQEKEKSHPKYFF